MRQLVKDCKGKKKSWKLWVLDSTDLWGFKCSFHFKDAQADDNQRYAFWVWCMWERWFSFAIDGLLLKCLGLTLKCGPMYICMGQVKRKWLRLSIIWFMVLHLKLTFYINQAAHEGASSALYPGRAPMAPFGVLGWRTVLGELVQEELRHWVV